MVFAYVTLHPTRDRVDAGNARIYCLLLPDAKTGEWDEVVVRASRTPGAGFGVYPRAASGRAGGIAWADLRHPVVLPYLGSETVVKDQHSLKVLLAVLRGDFERLSTGEAMAATGGQAYVADGLFAVKQCDARASKSSGGPRQPLPASVELLQVAHPEAANRFQNGVQTLDRGRSSVCYLVASEVRTALHLAGPRAHLFDLLAAHGTYDHTDRHLATHVATLHRKEEGHVLINGHPAFLDEVAMTALINEPPAQVSPTFKMSQSYARYLANDHPLMQRAGLRQPTGARAAWDATVLPPEGCDAAEGLSERMVLYASTRKKYSLQQVGLPNLPPSRHLAPH